MFDNNKPGKCFFSLIVKKTPQKLCFIRINTYICQRNTINELKKKSDTTGIRGVTSNYSIHYTIKTTTGTTALTIRRNSN